MTIFLKYFVIVLTLLSATQSLNSMDREQRITELLEMYPAPAQKQSWFANLFCCNNKQRLVHDLAVQDAESQGDHLKVHVLKYFYHRFFSKESEPDARVADSNQNEYFGKAIRAGRDDLVALFLAHGQIVNSKSFNYFSWEGPMYPLDYLIAQCPVDEDVDTSGYENVARLLIAHGAQVAVQPKRWPIYRAGVSVPRPLCLYGPPLQRAFFKHGINKWMIQLLIEHGADVLDQDGHAFANTLARHYPYHCDDIDVLLSCGADLNHGHSALPWLYNNGKKDKIPWLLSRGAAVDGKDEFGETVLHKAIQNGDVASLQMILQKAPFAKTKAEIPASKRRVIAALCAFKRLGVSRDMRTMLITYLHEDLCALGHGRSLLERGVALEKLAPYCPKLLLNTRGRQKYFPEKVIKKIVHECVAYRLGKLKELLSRGWLRHLILLSKHSWRSNRNLKNRIQPDVIALLNPNNVEQHRSGIKRNVKKVLMF